MSLIKQIRKGLKPEPKLSWHTPPENVPSSSGSLKPLKPISDFIKGNCYPPLSPLILTASSPYTAHSAKMKACLDAPSLIWDDNDDSPVNLGDLPAYPCPRDDMCPRSWRALDHDAHPDTQKARGIQTIQRTWAVTDWLDLTLLKHILITGPPCDVNLPAEGAFARPCPKTPRHGFVDSRMVTTRAEAVAIWEETQAAEKGAELLLAPVIQNATLSAVLADGLLTWGPGNDGATIGRDAQTLRLPDYAGGSTSLDSCIAVAVSESPYWEFVWDASKGFITQLRDGPKPPVGTADYIPRPVIVKRVVRPELKDLLKWEADVKLLRHGDVVYHAGGSLACHAAIHCICNNVTYVTSRQPVRGETLRRTQDAAPTTYPRDDFSAGFSVGIAAETPHALCLALGLNHSLGTLVMQPTMAARAAGFMVAAICRAGAAACYGELRHVLRHRKPADEAASVGRADVYTQVYKDPLRYLNALPDKAGIFNDAAHWESGSFGGPTWAACAAATVMLWSYLGKILRREGDLTHALLTGLWERANMVINQAHNGGWWFNKFLPSELMAMAANYPALLVASKVPLVEQLRTAVKVDIVPLPRRSAAATIAALAPALRPTQWEAATLAYSSASGIFRLRIMTASSCMLDISWCNTDVSFNVEAFKHEDESALYTGYRKGALDPVTCIFTSAGGQEITVEGALNHQRIRRADAKGEFEKFLLDEEVV